MYKCNVPRIVHYQWKHKYPDYKRAYLEVRKWLGEDLEALVYKRAAEGTDKPIIVNGKLEMYKEFDHARERTNRATVSAA